jgi:hypothetical protein
MNIAYPTQSQKRLLLWSLFFSFGILISPSKSSAQSSKSEFLCSELFERKALLDMSFLFPRRYFLSNKLEEAPAPSPRVSDGNLSLSKEDKDQVPLLQLISALSNDNVPAEYDFVHRLTSLSPQDTVFSVGARQLYAEHGFFGTVDDFVNSAHAKPDLLTFGDTDQKMVLTTYMHHQGDDRLNKSHYSYYLTRANLLKMFLSKPISERPNLVALAENADPFFPMEDSHPEKFQVLRNRSIDQLSTQDIPAFTLGYSYFYLSYNPNLSRSLALLVDRMKVGGLLYVHGLFGYVSTEKYPHNPAAYRTGNTISMWLKERSQGLRIINDSSYFFIIEKLSDNWSIPDSVWSPELSTTAKRNPPSLVFIETGKDILPNPKKRSFNQAF